MKRSPFLLLLLALSTPALAQAGPATTGAPAALAVPYTYQPGGAGQQISPTSATGLTVPSGTVYATICATTATVRYTTDGVTTPTSSRGPFLTAGTCINLSGASLLANFKAISASGVLDVEYFK